MEDYRFNFIRFRGCGGWNRNSRIQEATFDATLLTNVWIGAPCHQAIILPRYWLHQHGCTTVVTAERRDVRHHPLAHPYGEFGWIKSTTASPISHFLSLSFPPSFALRYPPSTRRLDRVAGNAVRAAVSKTTTVRIRMRDAADKKLRSGGTKERRQKKLTPMPNRTRVLLFFFPGNFDCEPSFPERAIFIPKWHTFFDPKRENRISLLARWY